MKRIVIDASSVILLFKAGLFADLIGAYQAVLTESVCQKKIEMLIREGRYSPKIIDYALTCPSEEMALFIPG